MTAELQFQTAGLLAERLRSQGFVLACAESCTGGLLAGAITDIAGSSNWFDRGFVAYSNEAKMAHLGVSAQTLERFGAVSEETAMEMASGALAATPSADFALSTTGIAGPGGATPGKPVGMVCFGFASRSGAGLTTRASTQTFSGTRQQVRQAAVIYALNLALELIPSGRGV